MHVPSSASLTARRQKLLLRSFDISMTPLFMHLPPESAIASERMGQELRLLGQLCLIKPQAGVENGET